MGIRLFDRKFGREFVQGLPHTPGVYLFRDEAERVLYVGKAKDLRRRLSTYRNAGRRKAHRKMQIIMRKSATVEIREADSERAALLLENELIRTLRPKLNVDGAFSFLYPAIGLRQDREHLLLCITTDVDAWEGRGFRWFGSFRSRPRTLEAYDALVDILSRLGHREPRSHLPELPRVRGSRLVGLRRLGDEVVSDLDAFLAGESRDGLGALAVRLLEKPRARRESGDVQTALACLSAFWDSDLSRLREAIARTGRPPGFVPQAERDALFIESRTVEDEDVEDAWAPVRA